jgi:hypothetical protein
MNSPLHPSTPAPQHILVTGGAGKSILLKILSRITELTPLGPPGTGEAGRAESKA